MTCDLLLYIFITIHIPIPALARTLGRTAVSRVEGASRGAHACASGCAHLVNGRNQCSISLEPLHEHGFSLNMYHRHLY